jgi:alanine-glyoxylate transaminase/serine-glyoxylate transaminase/serine-pyruvate transaminase
MPRAAAIPKVNAPMVLGTLGVVELALGALGIPHGAGGVQRAIDFLAREVPAP